MSSEQKGGDQSSRVVIYGAEAVPAALTENTRYPWRRLKRYARGQLDTVMRYVNFNRGLDYRHYVLPNTYNVGDYAISQATKQLFSTVDPKIAFTEINWGNLGDAQRMEGIREANLLVVAGSGYIFFDSNGGLSKRIQRDSEILGDLSVPIVMFGIGVNQPFALDGDKRTETLTKKDERTLGLLLDKAQLISVRDVGSQQLLQRYTDKCVRLIADPAFYFAPKSEAHLTPPEGRPLIGINFPFHGPLATSVLRKNLPRYAEMLRTLQQRTNCQYRYFVHFDSGLIIPKLLRHYGI